MPTTTKMGIVYPSSTDLVKDGATNMGTIATTVDAKTGLVLLNTTTFSAVSAQNIDGVFTSAFENYRIFIRLTAATSSPTESDVRVRLRAGGTTTTTNYTSQRVIQNATSVSGASSADANVGFAGLTYGKYFRTAIEVFAPQLAIETIMVSRGLCFTEAGSGFNNMYSVLQDSTTQFDGISILANSGTISGKAYIYGVNF